MIDESTVHRSGPLPLLCPHPPEYDRWNLGDLIVRGFSFAQNLTLKRILDKLALTCRQLLYLNRSGRTKKR